MIIYYSNRTKEFSQKLRKNMTPEEKHLWYDFLKNYPVQFRRQKQFDCYIVDFYCASAKLVIELDGSQHSTAEAAAYDAKRTRILETHGLRVLRFSDQQINQQFEGVCREIDRVVKERCNIEII